MQSPQATIINNEIDLRIKVLNYKRSPMSKDCPVSAKSQINLPRDSKTRVHCIP